MQRAQRNGFPWAMYKSGFGGCQDNDTCRTLNASAYQDILDNSSFQLCGNSLELFLFQHDCAPVHKAKSLKTWMTVWCGWTLLSCRECSPDELERRLRARPSHPTSMCDLTNGLREEFSKFPKTLVDSLLGRVDAIIAAKGVLTSYSTLDLEWDGTSVQMRVKVGEGILLDKCVRVCACSYVIIAVM